MTPSNSSISWGWTVFGVPFPRAFSPRVPTHLNLLVLYLGDYVHMLHQFLILSHFPVSLHALKGPNIFLNIFSYPNPEGSFLFHNSFLRLLAYFLLEVIQSFEKLSSRKINQNKKKIIKGALYTKAVLVSRTNTYVQLFYSFYFWE